MMWWNLVMIFSPLRSPGAASGRVVSAVSVTTCFHYLHLDGDRKAPRLFFRGSVSLFPKPRGMTRLFGPRATPPSRAAADPLSACAALRPPLMERPLPGEIGRAHV